MHGGRWPTLLGFEKRPGNDAAQSGLTVWGEDIMSAAEIDAGTSFAPASGGADEISRRLESLPASSYVWRLVILLSQRGCFEIYDLFFTGYIAPGLNRSGLLTTTTQAFFGFSGIGAFVAATFAEIGRAS